MPFARQCSVIFDMRYLNIFIVLNTLITVTFVKESECSIIHDHSNQVNSISNGRPLTRHKRALSEDNPVTSTSPATDITITCIPKLVQCPRQSILKYYPLFPDCERLTCFMLSYLRVQSYENVEQRLHFTKLKVSPASRSDVLLYELDPVGDNKYILSLFDIIPNPILINFIGLWTSVPRESWKIALGVGENWVYLILTSKTSGRARTFWSFECS